ncbi:gamma-glutamyl-gamma-aminobutyrate hydrolase family protein [Prochlorococcus marinus]|uniref:Glutamine amidotransferase domain-containing protein n=1 Tax=Prochlorococcus marinus (strain MIT 9303) TaxID=59922 RepID=A2CDW3_PROM3|nr:gamma-glutamyl-gamma-aminobutyrate hydrolase family protein [Prochlorococcus marinus]ABM79673.1 Hypothetical protein P9303_29431 [Prochlorococcus marinus str. MIT 9303]
MRVAITQRVDSYPDRHETRDALDQRLASFVSAAGLIPLPVPNLLSESSLINTWSSKNIDDWLSEIKPDGIILSGGNNIGECPERDKIEFKLLDFAFINDMPLLGICRGMQMMALSFGGKLEKVDGHVKIRHMLAGEIHAEVNSYHDFSLTDCPRDFRVLARSNDGKIEAIRHNILPWEGWMWHPERELSFDDRDINRLRSLLGFSAT